MERCNINIQYADFKEIIQKYNEVAFINKAIIQEYSAKEI